MIAMIAMLSLLGSVWMLEVKPGLKLRLRLRLKLFVKALEKQQ